MYVEDLLFIVIFGSTLYRHLAGVPLRTIHSVDSDIYQTDYLSRFGYLQSSLISADYESGFKSAVVRFQRLWGIPVTGQVDNETKILMKTPRCGNQDTPLPSTAHSHRRTKRFSILPFGGWSKLNLTYRVLNRPDSLTKYQLLSAVDRAFQQWASVSPLVFTRVRTKPDIDILFVAYEHGDGTFDGPGGTVAHTYYPVFGGDLHFDASEYWTYGTGKGTDVYQTAVHEIGHALGLSHTKDKKAVMYPYYRYQKNMKLADDDIDGIQFLYGIPKSRSLLILEHFCRAKKIDAALSTSDGHILLFVGRYVTKIEERGIARGFPKNISDVIPGVSANIDAAVRMPPVIMCLPNTNCRKTKFLPTKTVIFKGSRYYLYKKSGALEKVGFVSSMFPALPPSIDAAFVTSGRHIYIVKGEKYWRFRRSNRYSLDPGYPRLLSRDLKGLPSQLDAVLSVSRNNNKMYYNFFFQASKYYRITKGHFEVDKSKLPFPRRIASDWLNCPGKSNALPRSRMSLLRRLAVL